MNWWLERVVENNDDNDFRLVGVISQEGISIISQIQ